MHQLRKRETTASSLSMFNRLETQLWPFCRSRQASRWFAFAAMPVLLAVYSVPVHATGFNIVKLIQNERDQLIETFPNLFDDIVISTYNEIKPKVQTELVKLLGRGDLVASGFTFYDLNIALGAARITFTNPTTLQVTLQGNHIYAKSTLPGPTGSYADPAFEVNFDLRADLSLTLPSVSQPKLEFTQAVVSVPWIELKPRNVTGGIATTFAVVVNAFNKAITGKDIIQSAVRPYLTQDFKGRLNNKLTNINARIAKAFTRENVEKAETVLDQVSQALQTRVEPHHVIISRPGATSTSSPAAGSAIGAAAGKILVPKAGENGGGIARPRP